ncbi:hypothetical protein [Candidatus Electronema sp. JC]|uniref:hypothetical protein n=1 Tax=Candidatus Electronema sp. JC TaxID=3401570 RepID=UPI003B43BBF3
MDLLADTHLHLYPCYDLDRAFSRLLDQLGGGALRAGFLAERADCHVYEQLRCGDILLRDFTLEAADRRQLVLRRGSDGSRLCLLPGRQIVAAERIEVLALCTDALFADGLPAAELIKSIRAGNGVPVLPWSPGKWLFQRGRVIDGLLRQFSGQDLLIGDVSLRPAGWPLPPLLRKARCLGYQMICGSDPLPFSGEEDKFGSCGSRLTAAAELEPDALLRALLQGKAAASSVGRRSGLLELLRRLRRNAAVRRAASSVQHKEKT